MNGKKKYSEAQNTHTDVQTTYTNIRKATKLFFSVKRATIISSAQENFVCASDENSNKTIEEKPGLERPSLKQKSKND